jgi:hypothetical protein
VREDTGLARVTATYHGHSDDELGSGFRGSEPSASRARTKAGDIDGLAPNPQNAAHAANSIRPAAIGYPADKRTIRFGSRSAFIETHPRTEELSLEQ